MSPQNQLHVFVMMVSHVLSVLTLLCTFLFWPQSLIWGWSFLSLFQVVGCYSAYRLYKNKALDFKSILKHTQDTTL